MEAGAKKTTKRLSDKEWTDIRNEYVTSTISCKKLADKHGVPYATLQDHATEGKWMQERKKYYEKYAKKTVENLAQRRARACARKLNTITENATRMNNIMQKMLRDSKQFRRHINVEGLGMGVSAAKEQVFDKYDTRAMRDFVSTMKDLTAVLRDVYGIPGVIEQSAMDMALARLTLDKEKAEAGDGKNDAVLIIHDHTENAEVADERAASVAE